MSNNCCSCNCANKNKECFFMSFAKMSNDNKVKTVIVALILCLVCSFAVSLVAVSLRPIQNANNQAYKEKNILVAAGLSLEDSNSLNKITSKIVDIEKGIIIENVPLEESNPKYKEIYFVTNDNNDIEKLILPIGGKGAWGIINGFLVVYRKKSSHYNMPYNEIANVLFYEQSETPGLGGKIEEPDWRSNWIGKEIYDKGGNLVLEIVKGGSSIEGERKNYKVDGLSGATVTTRYTNRFTQFCLGSKGFKGFLENLRKKELENVN